MSEQNHEHEPVLIDRARPEDAPRIVEIQEATWLDTYPNEEYGITREDIAASELGGERAIAAWENVIRRYEQSPGARFLAARVDGVLRGYCTSYANQREGYIHTFYIEPFFQGKGIGAELMRAVFEWIGPDKPIYLEVVKYNEKAIRFYRKFGFQDSDVPIREMRPLASGKIMPEIKMVRPARV